MENRRLFFDFELFPMIDRNGDIIEAEDYLRILHVLDETDHYNLSDKALREIVERELDKYHELKAKEG